jgi:hypothetical protein
MFRTDYAEGLAAVNVYVKPKGYFLSKYGIEGIHETDLFGRFASSAWV